MSKNSDCGIFNTLKIKSKNRYVLNRKYKDKDMNKKDDMSYRSKCKNPDVSFGYFKNFEISAFFTWQTLFHVVYLGIIRGDRRMIAIL